MKRIVMGMMVAMMAGVGIAAPVISNLRAKQRYPWNGKVDITFSVTGVTPEYLAADEEDGKITMFDLSTVSYADGVERALKMKTFTDESGAKVDFGGFAVTNGTYHYVWDADADLPGAAEKILYATVRSTVATQRGSLGVRLWEGGPFWAECNVGAEKPEDDGLYFWWGDTVGHKPNGRSFSFNFNGASSAITTYNKSVDTLVSEGFCEVRNGKTVLKAEYDAATAHLGSLWRMATDDEIWGLVDNCTWTKEGDGWIVTGKGDFSGNSIYLPITGIGQNTSLAAYHSNSRYISSVPASDNNNSVEGIFLYSSGFYNTGASRANGSPVRAVRATP